jgi:microcystin-dependent protein
VLRASAPDLFAAIGTTWGAGNGATTFNLPDLKTAGRFLRSRSGSVAVGTLQADTVGAHNHPGSGSVSGTVSVSVAADGAWTPSISVSDPQHVHGALGGTFFEFQGSGGSLGPAAGNQLTNHSTTASAATGISASSSTAPTHTHAGSTASFSGSISVAVSNNTGTIETRPISASALACIRY